MPDDAGVAHALAIHGLLDALDYTVYLGEVTAADDALTFPYLVVWPPPPGRPRLTLAGYGGEVTTTTQVSAVGRDVTETIAAMGRASERLHRMTPTIAGRTCSPITQVPQDAGPPRPDERVRFAERPVYLTFGLFTLASSPAVMPV